MKSEIINLDILFSGTQTQYWTYSSSQRIFIAEISKIRNKHSHKLDTMILGNRLFNYISDLSGFHKVDLTQTDNYDDRVKVGILNEFHVYLDFNMANDIIYLTVDKNVMRDNIIDNILGEDTLIDDMKVEIKVISSLIDI